MKALDDALSDGMDVVNLSFSSLFPFTTGPGRLLGVAFDRMKNFGVMVIVAAGNGGPTLNSLSDLATLSSVISVGAIDNDRVFADKITVAGETYPAIAGSGPRPSSAVTGNVFDVEALDPTAFLCAPAGADTMTGQVALIMRGVCATISATLPFKLSTFAQEFRRITSFSSKGPTSDFRIKPDLAAVGTNIYTAAQSVDNEGESYSKGGYQIVDGTSFASPIVAGAAAVLRGARPGLTVDQYNSLLINGATPLMVNGGPLWSECSRPAPAC